VRQHGAQEEETAKASSLDFDVSASGAEFEQAGFSAVLSVFSAGRRGRASGCETIIPSIQLILSKFSAVLAA